MKNSETPPGVKLTADKEAAFGYDFYGTKKRYMIFRDDFADSKLDYHRSILAAHEIGHAEVFARLSRELGGDDDAFDLGTRTYNSNKGYYVREEAYVQRLAIERVAPLFPNPPSIEFQLERASLRAFENAVRLSQGELYGPIPRDLYGRVPFLPESPPPQ